MNNIFKGKTVLVTGGTGSIGSELVRQALISNARAVRVLSRDENKQYDLLEKLGHSKKLRMFIGDIRDKDRLDLAFRGADIVLHAAAMKHVPFCEYNPFEAVKTNIIGSQNVIEVALKNNVEKVIAISTDKATRPQNVMGVSKLMMEKLFTNANFYAGSSCTKFSCVRFGNVAWARGSVLPLWKRQADLEKRIKVTNGDMTRFFMSIEEACKLVIESLTIAQGGEIFIFKMPAVRLIEMAEMFVKKYYPKKNIKIKLTGIRSGEKMHEELFCTDDGSEEIFENSRMFIIAPKKEARGSLKSKVSRYPGFKKIASDINLSSKGSIDIKKIRAII